MEIRDLSKYGSSAVARGAGLTFADTSSPVDPGDKGKVAEAVDVCFPEKVYGVDCCTTIGATATHSPQSLVSHK